MKDELKETPSQTAGPYVHIGLMPQHAGLTQPAALGEEIIDPTLSKGRIRIEGIVIDGDGVPIHDIVIEVWQADADGHYHTVPADGFRGWGRVAGSFETGEWAFETVKPGSDGHSAPHLKLWLVARGINLGLSTRLYFADEDVANATDPVLQQVGPTRRNTLIAQPITGSLPTYRFDIHLQGDKETVFFDV